MSTSAIFPSENEPDEKHMEFVQQVIARMAGNSFLLKGWAVTLTAGLFALAAKDTDVRLAVLALLPVFAFWALDAYYLRQEKLFRALYDEIRKGEKNFRFSMDTSAVPEQDRPDGLLRMMISISVFPFYSSLLLFIGAFWVLLVL